MSPENRQVTSAVAPRRTGRSLNGLAVQVSVVALSFALVAVLVVTSSRAAFVAQTDNTVNTVSTAAIALTDNDSGTAMFANVTGLAPGTTVDRCIDVTYSGTIDPLPVVLYASSTPTGTLAPYLNLTVEVGPDTTAAYGDCTGFTAGSTVYTGTLQSFAAADSYPTGLTTWDPTTGPDTRTFRFRLAVQNDPAAQGLTTTFGFSWETRTP
jgi:hypothetical protein